MSYTEYEAVYDIVFWQFFVAFFVAIAGVVHSLPLWRGGVVPEAKLIITVIGFIFLCWFTTFLLLICLDMLFLPPIFAVLRLIYFGPPSNLLL